MSEPVTPLPPPVAALAVAEGPDPRDPAPTRRNQMPERPAPLRPAPEPEPEPAQVAAPAAARADALFGEIAVLTRRLARAGAELRALGAAHPGEPCPWTPAADLIGHALRATRAAGAAMPVLALLEGASGAIVLGELRIAPSARRATLAGTELCLPARQFDLLVRLAETPEEVVSKQALLREVWRFRSPGRTRTVESHASRLRQAFLAAGAAPGAYVVSAWGIGYSLLPPGGRAWLAEAS